MPKFCTNCAATLDPGVRFCAACGAQVEAAPAPNNRRAPATSIVSGERGRYPALRIISVILKVFSVFVAIGGLITGLSIAGLASSAGAFGGAGPFGGAAALPGGAFALFAVLGSLTYALCLWGSAEMITVVIDIEENTRRVASPVAQF